nr:response regulator [Actinomycetota bacterium]
MPSTVLIVDDDESIRLALRMMFDASEFDVVGEAADGVQAVLLALKHQPTLVVLDYSMPRLGGEGAAQILRSISPATRIVAFSGRLESKPDWADAFLNKERVTDVIPVLQTLLA